LRGPAHDRHITHDKTASHVGGRPHKSFGDDFRANARGIAHGDEEWECSGHAGQVGQAGLLMSMNGCCKPCCAATWADTWADTWAAKNYRRDHCINGHFPAALQIAQSISQNQALLRSLQTVSLLVFHLV
jgi:hypothetical protein